MIHWGRQSDQVTQKGLREEVMFEPRPEGGGANHAKFLEKGIPGKEDSKCKGP